MDRLAELGLNFWGSGKGLEAGCCEHRIEHFLQ